MSVLLCIPARFASSRYPGKPLVPLRGADGQTKSLIERSWRAALQVKGVDRVVVSTDDSRIEAAARDFGADVVITSTDCRNGTERCAETAEKLGGFDVVVNLQGDAPLTPPWFVEALIERMLRDQTLAAATPVLRCNGAALHGLLEDRRAGRVGGTTAVFGADGQALYFSKEAIPYTQQEYAADAETPVFHHVGVYAYRGDALAKYNTWPEASLEQLEGLEQLRFLENGVPMACVEVNARGRSFWELNNPTDVDRLEVMMAEMGMT